ncbi:glycoside hydrolase [Sistotremastrum niveocremeum HHB9708]|uniref:Beta-mannosidase B n=1 Tax=Sistotremastrum niveocremeum HHB9708 TaxID=1314777 RepID=A0A164V6B2_9AGAM|nr:glycoside hydrolase [Sistotremastrum niveocremeum HHB9708]
MAVASKTLELSENWRWKQRDETVESIFDELEAGWTPVKHMPSDIHVELMECGKIPDPYVGFNEHAAHWVGDAEWMYRTTFSIDPIHAANYELLFDGLDTICVAYLNEEQILTSDNMFTPRVVQLDVTRLQSSNTLLLHFKSAKKIAKQLETEYGRVRAGSCNLGDPSRGPELMTAGPWLPISLKSYSVCISDLYPQATVDSDLVPHLTVELSMKGELTRVSTIRCSLLDCEGTEAVNVEISPKSSSSIRHSFSTLPSVKLWWPVGYGEPNLYSLTATLIDEAIQAGHILDQQTTTLGFRRVALIQRPLAEADQYGKGTSFFFEVNNVPIYIGGSNWVPADNLLTTIKPERYMKWLKLLKDGNQNLVRLWGGGVYEPDVFYDTCDELGILVWQDFQFACGVYPAHPEFVESVQKEAEANVKRLRHHPCFALWCGNNEDYQQVLQWGGIAELPARKIYEEVLPEVVERLTYRDVPYWRGSPYGGKGWDTADPTVGDVHQWNIWAGEQKPYQHYNIMGGRFVSEFGIPSMPDLRTIDHWMDDNDKERYSNSKLMAQHCKAGSHETRFAILMNENFKLTGDFESHVYLTQILQSEGVSFAYRSWRREWRGPGREYNGGTIVWQLNDSWPVTSWAIADYFLRPKPAYYAIARELEPITVGILRKVNQNREHDRPRQFYEFGSFESRSATLEIWGTNSTLHSRTAILELQFIDLESAWKHQETHSVTLLPNQSTEFITMTCPSREPDSDTTITKSATVVVCARLVDPKTHGVIARYSDWPQPYRYVDFPDPQWIINFDGDALTVKAAHPVKGLVFSVRSEGNEVRFSDNALDLIPGEERVVEVEGLERDRHIYMSYMGSEHPRRIVTTAQ